MFEVGAGIFAVDRLSGVAAVYTGVRGPGGYAQDLTLVRDAGGYPVAAVDPGSPAARAGLRPGDTIVSVDGVDLSASPSAFFRVVMGGRPGDTVVLGWLRDGVEHGGPIGLVSRAGPYLAPDSDRELMGPNVGPAPWLRHFPYLLPTVLMLLVGAVIGFVRTRDDVAYRVALFLLVLANALSIFVDRAPVLPVLPLWFLTWKVAVSRLSIYPLALLGVSVLASFPNPTRVGEWLDRRKWLLLPYAVLAVESIVEGVGRVYGVRLMPPGLADSLDRLFPWSYLWLALLALAAMLILAQRVEGRARERVRLGVVEAGLAGSVVGGFWIIFLWNSSRFWAAVAAPRDPILSGVLATVAVFLPVLLLCSMPLSLGYAAFSRRVFGIRLILRRSIRYLLLSRGVLVAEGVILFVVLSEAIRYSQRGIGASVHIVTAISGSLSLLVVLAMIRLNRPLMRALDRRFFRENYDARRLLLDLSREMLVLREREDVLRRAGDALLDALYCRRVGFFLVGSEQPPRLAWLAELKRRSAAGPADLPERADPARIADGISALMDEGDIWEFPRDELEHAAAARKWLPFELLVALRGSARLRGVMALGAKRSGEPFTSEDRELLVTLGVQMGLALENAELLHVAKREAEQSREISIAREVQQNLFPQTLPTRGGWEFAATCLPARAVGGDYYDLFFADQDHLALAVGDVSGKGLGPALVASGVHSAVRSLLRNPSCRLSDLASDLNEHLLGSSSPEMFATLFVGVLDTASGRLRYVNCGHNPPILLSPHSGDAARLSDGGTVVGMLPGASYDEGQVELGPGAVLAIYSDGVTEAENATSEMFGEERLLKGLEAASTGSAESALTDALTSVGEFSRGAEQSDDITLVVVRRQT